MEHDVRNGNQSDPHDNDGDHFECLIGSSRQLAQGRDREEFTGEQDPDGEEGEEDVEYLADDVKPENLPALHLLGNLLEVGIQADTGECEDERPVLLLVEYLVDGSYLVGSA
jgi:hypothetical protein